MHVNVLNRSYFICCKSHPSHWAGGKGSEQISRLFQVLSICLTDNVPANVQMFKFHIQKWMHGFRVLWVPTQDWTPQNRKGPSTLGGLRSHGPLIFKTNRNSEWLWFLHSWNICELDIFALLAVLEAIYVQGLYGYWKSWKVLEKSWKIVAE